MADGSAARTLDRVTSTQFDLQQSASTCIFKQPIPLIKITTDTVGNVFDLCKAAVKTHHNEAQFIAVEYLDRPVGIDLGCKWHFDHNHKYCVYMIVRTARKRKLVHVCPKMLLHGSLCKYCKPEYSNGWVKCLLPFEQVSSTRSWTDLDRVVTRPGKDGKVMHGMKHKCEGNFVRFQEREDGSIKCICGRTHVDVTPGDLYTSNRVASSPVVQREAPTKQTGNQVVLGVAPAKNQAGDLQPRAVQAVHVDVTPGDLYTSNRLQVASSTTNAVQIAGTHETNAHGQSSSSANQAYEHQSSTSTGRSVSIFTSEEQAELVEAVRNAIEACKQRITELDAFESGVATIASNQQVEMGAASLEIEEEEDSPHHEAAAATGKEHETIASAGHGQESVADAGNAHETVAGTGNDLAGADDAGSVSNFDVSQVDGLDDIDSLPDFGLGRDSDDPNERLKEIMTEISQSSVPGAYGQFEDPEQVIASIRMHAFLEPTSQSEHLIPAFLTVLLLQTDRGFRQQLQTTSPIPAMASEWDRLQLYPTASTARGQWITTHGFPWGFGFLELEIRFNTRATDYTVTRQRLSGGGLGEPMLVMQTMTSLDEVRDYLLANTADDEVITIEIPSSDLDLSLHMVNERQAGRDRYQRVRDSSYVVWQLRSSNDSGYKKYRATPFQHICTVVVDETSPERDDTMLSELIESWRKQITDDLHLDSYRQNFQDEYWRITYLMEHNYHGFGFHLHDLLTELVLSPTSPSSKRRRTDQTSSSSSSSAGPNGSSSNGSSSASSSEESHNHGWNSIVQRLREDSPRMRYDPLEDSMYRERLAAEWMAARTVELIRFDQSLQSEERRKEVTRLIRQAQVDGVRAGYARYQEVTEELKNDQAIASSSSSRPASPVDEAEMKRIAREVAVDAMRTATANALQEQGLLNETTRQLFTQSFQQEITLIMNMLSVGDTLDDLILQLGAESMSEENERDRVVHRLDLCRVVLGLMELLGWTTE